MNNCISIFCSKSLKCYFVVLSRVFNDYQTHIVEIAKYILCTYVQVGSKVHRRSDGRASGSSHVEDKDNAMTLAGSGQMQRQRQRQRQIQIHYSTFRQGSCKKLHHHCHHVMAACGNKATMNMFS